MSPSHFFHLGVSLLIVLWRLVSCGLYAYSRTVIVASKWSLLMI